MPPSARLRVSVEIRLQAGFAAGRRHCRLSRALELPPRLYFDGELPVDGRCGGEVSFTLPDGGRVESDASLYFDPEHPEQGSEAELVGLGAEQLQLLETYIEQRATS